MIKFFFVLLAIAVIFMFIQHLFIFVYLSIEMKLANIYDKSYEVLSKKKLLENCLKEFKFFMAKFYLYPLKFTNANAKGTKDLSSKQIVILVHGFGRSQVDWFWFKKELGLANVYTVNLHPSFSSIEKIASNLDLDIQKIIKENGHNEPEVILIGHSMGGLVSSYYATSLDKAHQVKQIFTLGSPWHGTKIAVAASAPNMVQMQPQSPFLAALRMSIANNPRLKIYNLNTKTDNLIFPWNSPILETTNKNNIFTVDSESHLGLIHNPQIVQKIKYWLTAV